MQHFAIYVRLAMSELADLFNLSGNLVKIRAWMTRTGMATTPVPAPLFAGVGSHTYADVHGRCSLGMILEGHTRARRPRRQMPGDPIEAMEFAQSKAKARKEGQTSVTFADVAGIDPIVSELQGIVEVISIFP